MVRPQKGEARSAILKVADQLFYRDGIRAVGVDTIAAEAGVTKRTLYYHFPTKDALVDAYLAQRDLPTRQLIIAHAEQAGPLPGDHVLGVFDGFATWFATADYRGCAYLNALAESGSQSDTVCGRVAEHKNGIRDWIETKLIAAQADDPQDVAEQIMLLIDGAMSRAQIYGGRNITTQARKAAELLLKLAGVTLSVTR